MPPQKFLPKYITQVKPTGPNADCGPVSTAILVDYASAGAVRTKQAEVREKMGAPATGFTNLSQAKIAIGKFQKRFEKKKLRAPSANYHPDRPFTRLIETLENGRAAQVGILYGVVKDLRPAFYSIDDFLGRHFVTVMKDPDPDHAGPTVLVYDPLADGRMLKSGRRAKMGPQSWPQSLLMNAADAYVQDLDPKKAAQHTIKGEALASWVSVTRVKAADGAAPDEPEPGDVPTLRDRIKDLKQQLKDLNETLDERDERITSLESGLADIGSLTTAVAAAQPDIAQILSTVDKLIPAGVPFEPDEDSAEANSTDGADPDDVDHM